MDPNTSSPAHRFPAPPPLANTHSPSRSPSRRTDSVTQNQDSLLSRSSSSYTLDTLPVGDETVRTESTAGTTFVLESVASASNSEKAWAFKAALAGNKVREWYAEIEGWTWPGFDRPLSDGPIERSVQYHQKGHGDRRIYGQAISPNGSGIEKQNEGALSSKLVQEYDERIQTIRDDMEALEIEDLKDYVLNTHFKANSRRSSLHDPQTRLAFATEYNHLDDFTTVITATIVQALPTISRLETLLNTWSTRLLVLRQVPSFLADLEAGRESMISASIAIGAHNARDRKRKSEFSPKAFSDIQAVLKDQIAQLGRRLDRMLDLLEGSADTLPDAWVDGLDNIENEYSAWVVKAERLAMNKELDIVRLENGFTHVQGDEFGGPLELRPATSTLDIDAQFDEIRHRADGDFDLTQLTHQIPSKTEESDFSDHFDLEPFPSRDASPNQGLRHKPRPREAVASSIDKQSLDGLIGLETPSLPSRSSHRPAPLDLAGSTANVKRSDSPDAGSDTSGSGSVDSNFYSNKSSPEIQSAVVAEYIGSPARVASPTSLGRDPITPLDISFQTPFQRAAGDGLRIHQNGVGADLVPKNPRPNGGSGHVRTRSTSLQSFENAPKHEIRRIQVQRSGSYSSALSLSDPKLGMTPPSKPPTSSASGETSYTITPFPAYINFKHQPSSPAARNLDQGLDVLEQRPLYHPPPPVLPPAVPSRLAPLTKGLDQGPEMLEHRNSYHSPSASRHSKDQPFSPPSQKLDPGPDIPMQRPFYHPPPPIPPPAVPQMLARLAQEADQDLDMAKDKSPYHSPPPVPPRSVHRFEEVSDLGKGFTPVKIQQMKSIDPTSSHVSSHVETTPATAQPSTNSFDNQLEERISSILTELPTQIRLTSGPEPDAPEVLRFNSPSDPKTPKTRSPAWRLKRTHTSTPLPSMTLAPAQPKSSKSRSQGSEPDIKLYHLHQAGKTAPIKLFVRLVGDDGERVMVRIGGGWADLGEYLREYASHHSRRSVSDSPFDIQGFPSSPVTNQSSPRSRPGSRPPSPTSTTKFSPAMMLHRQQTSPAIFHSPHTPQSDPSRQPSSRLSWVGADEASSPSLGLAGPKTKNVDISPREQAWVDEMMEQARSSGTERKGGGESAVGDLGKVGKTRRVFFRSKKEG